MADELAKLLAGGYDSPLAQYGQPPASHFDAPFDLEKAYRNHLSREKWGADLPWYLPEEMVGDWLYRHQGVLAHSALAALPHNPPPIRAGNLAYVLYSLASGKTQRPKIGEGGIPLMPGEEGIPPVRENALAETADQRRDREIKADPMRAMYAYGGATWPWEIDQHGTRKKDPGIPPLPGTPY